MKLRPTPRIVSKIRRTASQAYTQDWSSISKSVLDRDGRKCRSCGASGPGVRLVAHHVIPVSRGGRTTLLNLKTLCSGCHSNQPFHNHLH